MMCAFNEANPSDKPKLLRITKNGEEPIMFITKHVYLTDEQYLNVLRNITCYLVTFLTTKNGVTYEGINVLPHEIEAYIASGKIPAGTYVADEGEYSRRCYKVMRRKVHHISEF